MILRAKRLGFGGETTKGDRGEMTCGGNDLERNAGSCFVLLKVTCSPYGINRIGLVVQDGLAGPHTSIPTL